MDDKEKTREVVETLLKQLAPVVYLIDNGWDDAAKIVYDSFINSKKTTANEDVNVLLFMINDHFNKFEGSSASDIVSYFNKLIIIDAPL